MEEISDINTMFDLMRTPGEISPIERLLNEFEAHESKEEQSIEYYKKVLGETPNPMTRFLLQMIISDEEKHRAVIHAMVATLKGSLNWTKPAGSLEGATNLAELTADCVRRPKSLSGLKKKGSRNTKL